MSKRTKSLNRDVSIDICRITGTILVMLAHVSIPTFLSDVRSFDVILLVIISGMCFSGAINYGHYIWKRIKRLVLPTWILLILLFTCTYAACIILNRQQVYSFSQIWRSFFFLEGSIGYIWIVRVYLAIAIVNPILFRLNKTIPPLAYTLLMNLIIVAFSFFPAKKNGPIYYAHETAIYCLVASWGTKLKSLDKKHKMQFIVITTVCSFIGLIVTVITNGFNPNSYKYPPTAQYIYYGFLISIILIIFLKWANLDIIPEKIKDICSYWSANSFTLYIVHIFVLSMLNSVLDSMNLTIHWTIFYIVLLMISMLGVLLLGKFRFYLCRVLRNRKKCEK